MMADDVAPDGNPAGNRSATGGCHGRCVTGARNASRLRKAGVLLAAVLAGAGVAPVPAGADGPGYGGNADALTVLWQADAQQRGLAVYAVGFRGGSPVQIRVGAEQERTVTADAAGAVDLLLASAVTSTSAIVAATGASVLVTGHTPAGELRTLIGAVPPQVSATGAAEIIPWLAALAGSLVAGLMLRRRYGSAFSGELRRYRHPARHRV